MAKIGIARVSTRDQSLDIQINKLENEGCDKIFQVKHSGASKANKDLLKDVLDYAREGDIIIVTKLDRVARSMSQLLRFIDDLKDKQIFLKCLDFPLDTSKTDPISTALMQLLGIFSELERNIINERTHEGRVLSGNFGGRKSALSKNLEMKVVDELKKGTHKSVLARFYNVSRTTILRIQKKYTS